eukprot:331438_1
MTTNFWIPSMQLIKELAMKAAFRLFGNRNHEVQSSFCGYLNALLLHHVFEGYMQPSNARRMWLVPASSYRTFLNKYNHHLNVVIDQHPSIKAKDMRCAYVKSIAIKHVGLQQRFHGAMKQFLAASKPARVQLRTHVAPVAR